MTALDWALLSWGLATPCRPPVLRLPHKWPVSPWGDRFRVDFWSPCAPYSPPTEWVPLKVLKSWMPRGSTSHPLALPTPFPPPPIPPHINSWDGVNIPGHGVAHRTHLGSNPWRQQLSCKSDCEQQAIVKKRTVKYGNQCWVTNSLLEKGTTCQQHASGEEGIKNNSLVRNWSNRTPKTAL